ncbi:secreted protein [Pelomyxa schiedti]|nr:secreted protein [Pelomyxa schiedti]
MRKDLVCGVVLLSCLLSLSMCEPNPPTWPKNVYIFDPATPSTTQAAIDAVFAENGGNSPPDNGQWSNSRYALMFMPGTHAVTVDVGYYTSVIGLGKTPQETTLQTLRCQNGDFDYTVGALNNFWRSAEGFSTQSYTLWAVSQAAPMRRVVISGNMDLYQYNYGCCAGYASGGYLADSIISGTVTSGSQQQWLTRNTNMGSWSGSVWNMVFVGCAGGLPTANCGSPTPFTLVTATPVIAEKPYITLYSGKYNLVIPKVEYNKVGVTSNYDNANTVGFENVFVATETDTAATINAKLDSGLHVVLSPGNYNLTESIVINNKNTVLLGIGFPTLISTNGNPCITVASVDGVRVAGILVQAGKIEAPVLVKWGTTDYSGDSTNPGFIYDLFVRVGGDNDPFEYQVSADTMLEVNSGNVVIDNTWLWRADHYVGGGIVYNSMNPAKHSAVMNGNDITAYGLFAEHTLQDMVLWNGEGGRTYFFQSEYPYDVTQANYGSPGYAAYRVNSTVTTHNAWGVGVYSYFRDYSVVVNSGIATPGTSGISFTNSLTVFLNGMGSIQHVVNNNGDAVYAIGMQEWLCSSN